MKGDVWLYPSVAGWHFVSVGKSESEEIKKTYSVKRRGFGAVPVFVTVGKTNWETSIFPEKQSGKHLLPLKAEVRKKESIGEGDTITFSIEIRENDPFDVTPFDVTQGEQDK